MIEKRFTIIVEDDGYWIRDESDFKIIATGLKLGIAANLISYLNELHDENEQLKQQLESEHQMLDNAILLERTRMGKNCLKQYREAIQ